MLVPKCSPVAVPGVRLGDGAPALHTDRCHSLRSLDSATGGAPIAPHRRPGHRLRCVRKCGVWIDLLDLPDAKMSSRKSAAHFNDNQMYLNQIGRGLP